MVGWERHIQSMGENTDLRGVDKTLQRALVNTVMNIQVGSIKGGGFLD
jgi:hypothetical protein